MNINPITRLDYPDLDVIRVGEFYYMVSTTMYFFREGRFCVPGTWSIGSISVTSTTL